MRGLVEVMPVGGVGAEAIERMTPRVECSAAFSLQG